MDRYNKIYFILWLLFSMLVLSVTSVTRLGGLAGVLDPLMTENSVGLSFIIFLLVSELLGFLLASFTISRTSWNT